MRIGFSIILNGLHHLEHNNYAEFLANNLDLWIIAEGVSLNQGSTKWCKEMPRKYHDFGISNDGTWKYINQLSDKYPNVRIANQHIDSLRYKDKDYGIFWNSKDSQVNACIEVLKFMNFSYKIHPFYLWQVDIDEQWKLEDMKQAEFLLDETNSKTGMFHCNYWVGQNLQVKGEWGEGIKLPYKRLWKWEGESFQTHEPPLLEGGNGKETLLPQRFDHYAYYFDKDVGFKNDWYSGHEGIYDRWLKLQEDEKDKPIGYEWPISILLDPRSYWGNTNTKIVKVKND